MSYMFNTGYERISEEANGCILPIYSPNEQYGDLGFDFLSDELNVLEIPLTGVCDSQDFADAAGNGVEADEFNVYLGPTSVQNPPFECDNTRALMNNLPIRTMRKEKPLQINRVPIELSQSVGVGRPDKILATPYKVQIVNELELYFRPRYKSDYFAQNGKSRKPRYVADRQGNHYITLKVPIGIRGKIRIDWLTLADKSGDRFTMPYRFQQSNESEDVPDCNPMFIDITPDKHGIMKVYLVLIKSKQDELKNLQPLVPFRPLKDAFGIGKEYQKDISLTLNPKQLIQKYRLDQSQLAFTYCALTADGQNTIPEWDTTVYSTVLTELPPKNTKAKSLKCPNCEYVFDMPTAGNDDEDSIQENPTNKRKASGNTSGRGVKKQNSLPTEMSFYQ